MNRLIQYITEYKGVALHNSRKSIGTPDGVTHYYKDGFIELDYGDYNSYAFIYNKKNNAIVFGESADTHREIFIDNKYSDKGKEIGLDKLQDTKQLRYTGPFYSFNGKDPKGEMKKWYEENKEHLKVICEGRIWYIESIQYELQDYDYSWAEDNEDKIAKYDDLNKNVRAYIAFWNDLPSNKFKEYCDNIIKQFNAKIGRKKVEEYIAIGNNGEPILMNINDKSNVEVKSRTAENKKRIDDIWMYHADITEKGRKRKKELLAGYNKSRTEHFQRDYYNTTKSKTAAEWHNNKTKRYNKYTGKMEWGEKIGDSLIPSVNNINEMKSLETFIIEKEDKKKSTLDRAEIKFIIWESPDKKVTELKSNSAYQKIEYKLEDKKKGISIDFLLGYKDGSWQMWIGKIGSCSYDDDPYRSFNTDNFKKAIVESIDVVEEFVQKVEEDPQNYVQFYKSL